MWTTPPTGNSAARYLLDIKNSYATCRRHDKLCGTEVFRDSRCTRLTSGLQERFCNGPVGLGGKILPHFGVLKMILKSLPRVLVGSSALLLLASSGVSEADSRGRPEKMTVLIEGVGSSVRTIFAGNQDSYLASITDKAGHKQVIKLIDWFPGYIEEWSPGMALGGTYRIVSFRAEWCDSTSNELGLTKSQKVISPSLGEVGMIPCYRIEHRRSKNVQTERR